MWAGRHSLIFKSDTEKSLIRTCRDVSSICRHHFTGMFFPLFAHNKGIKCDSLSHITPCQHTIDTGKATLRVRMPTYYLCYCITGKATLRVRGYVSHFHVIFNNLLCHLIYDLAVFYNTTMWSFDVSIFSIHIKYRLQERQPCWYVVTLAISMSFATI